MKKLLISMIFVEIVVKIFNIKSYYIPSPSSVLIEFMNNFTFYSLDYFYTFSEALIGLILAILISIMLLYFIINKRELEDPIMNTLTIIQVIPVIIIAPILLIWLGFGMSSKILLCCLLCIFPIITALLKGVKTIDQNYYMYFKTINASKKDIFIHLELPYLLPYFFSGLKICATYCFSTALMSEYVGAKHGLGMTLAGALTSYNYQSIYVVAVLICVTTLVFLKLVDILEIKIRLIYKGVI